MSNQNLPGSSYPGYTATDSYCQSGQEEPGPSFQEPSFQDPHVPVDSHNGARGTQVEAMELQDLEFEAAESNSGRRAS